MFLVVTYADIFFPPPQAATEAAEAAEVVAAADGGNVSVGENTTVGSIVHLTCTQKSRGLHQKISNTLSNSCLPLSSAVNQSGARPKHALQSGSPSPCRGRSSFATLLQTSVRHSGSSPRRSVLSSTRWSVPMEKSRTS